MCSKRIGIILLFMSHFKGNDDDYDDDDDDNYDDDDDNDDDDDDDNNDDDDDDNDDDDISNDSKDGNVDYYYNKQMNCKKIVYLDIRFIHHGAEERRWYASWNRPQKHSLLWFRHSVGGCVRHPATLLYLLPDRIRWIWIDSAK